MAGTRLPEEVVQRLLTYAVPETELRAMRVVTAEPWQRIPPIFGAWAMTLGHHVLFASGRYDVNSSWGLALIAHESGHIAQWRELGVVRFITQYAWGLIQARFNHARHPLEQPLNERQRSVRRAIEGEAQL